MIKEGAFKDCTGLFYVALSDSVTCIERYAFQNCSSIKVFYVSKNFGNLDSEHTVAFGADSLKDCESLELISFDTLNQLTGIGAAITGKTLTGPDSSVVLSWYPVQIASDIQTTDTDNDPIDAIDDMEPNNIYSRGTQKNSVKAVSGVNFWLSEDGLGHEVIYCMGTSGSSSSGTMAKYKYYSNIAKYLEPTKVGTQMLEYDAMILAHGKGNNLSESNLGLRALSLGNGGNIAVAYTMDRNHFETFYVPYAMRGCLESNMLYYNEGKCIVQIAYSDDGLQPDLVSDSFIMNDSKTTLYESLFSEGDMIIPDTIQEIRNYAFMGNNVRQFVIPDLPINAKSLGRIDSDVVQIPSTLLYNNSMSGGTQDLNHYMAHVVMNSRVSADMNNDSAFTIDILAYGNADSSHSSLSKNKNIYQIDTENYAWYKNGSTTADSTTNFEWGNYYIRALKSSPPVVGKLYYDTSTHEVVPSSGANRNYTGVDWYILDVPESDGEEAFSILCFFVGQGSATHYIPDFPSTIDDGFWFTSANKAKITKIAIQEGITQIGTYAFKGLTNVTNIWIPHGMKAIGEGALESLSIETLYLPNTAISLAYQYDINNDGYCSSPDGATDTTPFLDIPTLKYIQYVRSTTTSYTDADVDTKLDRSIYSSSEGILYKGVLTSQTEEVDEENVTTYTITRGLKALVCPPKLTGSVSLLSTSTSIGDKAFNKSHLTSLNMLSAADNLISIGTYFMNDADNIVSITIPYSVTTIGIESIQGCANLQYLTIGSNSGGDTFTTNLKGLDGATSGYSMGEVLTGCPNFSELMIYGSNTNSWKLPKANLLLSGEDYLPIYLYDETLTPAGTPAIYSLPAGKDVYSTYQILADQPIYSTGLYYKVTDSGMLFIQHLEKDKTADMSKWTVSDTDKTVITELTQVPWYIDMNKISKVRLPDTLLSVGPHALHGSIITEASIPSTVTKIGDYAFASTSLGTLSIPDSVLHIGSYAFNGCTSLDAVVIGPYTKTIGENAFIGCSELSSIEFRGSGNWAVGDDRFPVKTWYLNGMESEKISCIPITVARGNIYFDTVIADGTDWISCGKVTDDGDTTTEDSVKFKVVGTTVYIFGQNATTSTNQMIEYNSTTSKTSLEQMKALYHTAKSSDMADPQNILIRYVDVIPEKAFSGATSLQTISVIGVKTIGAEAFKGTTSLQNVILPASVDEIGRNAFESSGIAYMDIMNTGISKIGSYVLKSSAKTVDIRLAGTSVGSLSDKTYTPILSPGTLSYFMTDNVTGYAVVGQVMSDINGVPSPIIIAEGSTKTLKLEGHLIQSTGSVYANLETSGITLQDSTASSSEKQYFLYKNGSWTKSTKSVFTMYTQGGVYIEGSSAYNYKHEDSTLTFDISKAVVELSESTKEYDGAPFQPSILSVKVHGYALSLEEDKDFSYEMPSDLVLGTGYIRFWSPYDGSLERTVPITVTKRISVIFHENDGSEVEKIVLYPDSFLLPEGKEVDGKKFVGWYDEDEKLVSVANRYYQPLEDITLYATYVSYDSGYTITIQTALKDVPSPTVTYGTATGVTAIQPGQTGYVYAEPEQGYKVISVEATEGTCTTYQIGDGVWLTVPTSDATVTVTFDVQTSADTGTAARMDVKAEKLGTNGLRVYVESNDPEKFTRPGTVYLKATLAEQIELKDKNGNTIYEKDGTTKVMITKYSSVSVSGTIDAAQGIAYKDLTVTVPTGKTLVSMYSLFEYTDDGSNKLTASSGFVLA